MKLYVKSAGFSVEQDYAWVNESGRKVALPAVLEQCRVDGVRFVLRSTKDGVFVYASSFVDKSRMDMYRRPLRNYIFLEGNWQEADALLGCFASMILDQEAFAQTLCKSVRDEREDTGAGFSVDFQALRDFLTKEPMSIEARSLRRGLCTEDCGRARRELLGELRSALKKRAAVCVLVGGTVSRGRLGELKPDRAVLSDVESSFYLTSAGLDENSVKKAAIAAAGGVAAIGLIALYRSRRKSVKNKEMWNIYE